MLNKKSVDDINVKGKKVLVRCDFNVPLQDGKITDENRLVAALPTIKKLIADGGKVILCSHLGKPKGEPKPELSLAPVAVRLSELLGQDVKFAADDNVVGDNAKAALITRGLREMVEYGVAHGGKKDTFFGLTGVGDLIVTCFSPHSRNYQAGLKIGKMNSSAAIENSKTTVEGIHSCKSVYEDSVSLGIEMPIVSSIYRVLFEGAEPKTEIANIMGRTLKSEKI